MYLGQAPEFVTHPSDSIKRALACLTGVLPNHLTGMPAQKEECSECALSLSRGRSKKIRVPSMKQALRGRASGWCGAGEGSRSALGSEEPDCFRSSSGVGRSLHGWQLEDDGGGSTRPWAEAEICTATWTETWRLADLQGWVYYCRVVDAGGGTVYCFLFFVFFFLRAMYKLKKNITLRIR